LFQPKSDGSRCGAKVINFDRSRILITRKKTIHDQLPCLAETIDAGGNSDMSPLIGDGSSNTSDHLTDYSHMGSLLDWLRSRVFEMKFSIVIFV